MYESDLQRESEDSSDSPLPGYVSAGAKSKLVKRVVIVAVISGLIQILIPVVQMISQITEVFKTNFSKSIVDPENGAFWNGSLWLLKEDSAIDAQNQKLSLLKWDPSSDKEPEIAVLPTIQEPILLQTGDTLWVVGKDRIIAMTKNGSKTTTVEEPLGYASNYFIWKGAPAAIEEVNGEFVLKTWNGTKWEATRSESTNLEKGDKYINLLSYLFTDDAVGPAVVYIGEDSIRFRESLSGFAKEDPSLWPKALDITPETRAFTWAFIGGKFTEFTIVQKNFSQRILGKRFQELDKPIDFVDFDIGFALDLGA